MKRFLLALGLLACALPVGASAQEAKQDFTLVNKTGYELGELYVSPSKADNWEEDLLDDDSMDDGESRDIHFHSSVKTCKWDLKVVYADDDSSAVWQGIDLCVVSKITLRYNRKSGDTSATFD